MTVVTLFDGETKPQGNRTEVKLSHFFARPLKSSEPAPGQWSPTLFTSDYRRKANAETVTCFAGDCDDWLGSALDFGTALHTALGDTWCAYHTTKRATAEALRFRFVVGFSHPISASAFPALWRALRDLLATESIYIDNSTKDVSKAYRVPWRAESGEGVWHYGATGFEGLDVDTCIRAGKRILAAEHQPPIHSCPIAHADRYTLAALEREAALVRNAGAGTRNAQLSKSTWSLARLDGLTASDIEQALTAAAQHAGLCAREIQATIRAALRARKKAS